MPMEVVLLKSFREMIKGPALIALLEKTSWKSERGKEFGKFQHRKDKQQYEQNLYEELFNIDFYNILEIHSKFLILYGNLVLQCELSFSVYSCLFVTVLGILKLAQNQLSTMSTYLYHTRTTVSQRKKINSRNG